MKSVCGIDGYRVSTAKMKKVKKTNSFTCQQRIQMISSMYANVRIERKQLGKTYPSSPAQWQTITR